MALSKNRIVGLLSLCLVAPFLFHVVRKPGKARRMLLESPEFPGKQAVSGLHEAAKGSLRSGNRLYDWSAEKEREIKTHQIKTLFLYFYQNDKKDHHETIGKIASQFSKHDLLFVRVPSSAMTDFGFMLDERASGTLPFAAIVDVKSRFRKYRYPHDHNASIDDAVRHLAEGNRESYIEEHLIRFVKDFFGKHLEDKVWVRSEDPYFEINDSAADLVKNIAGTEFRPAVMQSPYDVLLTIYAPWCGHCKRFESEFLNWRRASSTRLI
eukprot:GHVU01055131.1.p1 GENE.GHVU01055131.1~~GHVU01055131.1.p1  ORF type:complete len:267 (+),score=25.79 GHVU01055131.1:257-1057(+)